MKANKLIGAISVVAIAAIGQSQVSTHSVNSSAFVGASNTEFSPYSIPNIDGNYSTVGAPVNASGSQSFGGSNSNGDFDTMTFSGTGFASAQYGQLKTSASGELENAFYNSDNPWYWNSNTNELNEDGTPDVFISAGQATFNDTFTYSNYGPAVTVNFFYQVSGTFTGEEVYHSLYVSNDGDSDYIYLDTFQGNSFNQTWVTKNFSIGDGVLDHSTNSLSSFLVQPEFYPDGSLISGTANFSSTITLTGMELRDANGALVNGWSMSSASGTVYPVPEPASMTILGLAALAAFKRKRK
jgi:hypothetical protein